MARFRTWMKDGKWLALPGEALPDLAEPPTDPKKFDPEGSRLQALYVHYARGTNGARIGNPPRTSILVRELFRESQRRIQIVWLASNGLSLRSIGDRFEISHGSVRSVLILTMRAIANRLAGTRSWSKLGYDKNREPDTVRARAVALRRDGLKFREIADQLHVSCASVCRWVR